MTMQVTISPTTDGIFRMDKAAVTQAELEKARDAAGQAYDLLQQEMDKLYTDCTTSHDVHGIVNDSLHAFALAMNEQFQVIREVGMDSFFGHINNKQISIKIGLDKEMFVPIGVFKVPGVEGSISVRITSQTSINISAETIKKCEPIMHELYMRTLRILREQSIYKGKAIRVNTFETPGLLEPEYMDTSRNGVDSLILPSGLMADVSTSIFTPIQYTAAVRASGQKLKRGVLLAGPYGTGKTLTAYVTAHLCEAHGWTFVYVKDVDELEEGIKFAKQYQPAVVFCEDLDAVLSGDRNSDMNSILNIADGIDTKHEDIMLVLTTNHVEQINPAMLRPGRLDHVIHFCPPDSAACEKLLRYYAGATLHEQEDITDVAQVCAENQMIPAVIEEVVKRSKLHAIEMTKGLSAAVTRGALLRSAEGMHRQIALINKKDDEPTAAERLASSLSNVVEMATKQVVNGEDFHKQVHHAVVHHRD